MTSFSEYSGNFLSGTDLQGKEWLVQIERIVEQKVGDNDKLVVHFSGRRKSLPLNKSNIAVLSQAFGDDPQNCRGAKVVLFPEQTRTPSGQPAIGVRIKLPQSLAQQPQQPRFTTFVPDARERAQQAVQPSEALAQMAPPPDPEFNDEVPF